MTRIEDLLTGNEYPTIEQSWIDFINGYSFRVDEKKEHNFVMVNFDLHLARSGVELPMTMIGFREEYYNGQQNHTAALFNRGEKLQFCSSAVASQFASGNVGNFGWNKNNFLTTSEMAYVISSVGLLMRNGYVDLGCVEDPIKIKIGRFHGLLPEDLEKYF